MRQWSGFKFWVKTGPYLLKSISINNLCVLLWVLYPYTLPPFSVGTFLGHIKSHHQFPALGALTSHLHRYFQLFHPNSQAGVMEAELYYLLPARQHLRSTLKTKSKLLVTSQHSRPCKGKLMATRTWSSFNTPESNPNIIKKRKKQRLEQLENWNLFCLIKMVEGHYKKWIAAKKNWKPLFHPTNLCFERGSNEL